MPEERQGKRRRGLPSPFTAVRLVRLGMSAVRTVGAIGAFFANPASLAVLVPVGLFVLALFIILFGSGFTGAPAVPGAPGVAPIPQPTFPPGVASDCPVPNGEITCASYGPVYSGGGATAFAGNCGIDEKLNGGHCNDNYQKIIGICKVREDATGQLIRTAKSIDVTTVGGNKPGDPVYLPTIGGKSLKWYYQGYVDAGSDFGKIRLFQSEPTPEGVWSIHFVHVSSNNPPLQIGQEVKSASVGATMIYQNTGTHVHVTIGLNVNDSLGNLQDYSPNWKFADRELGMCIK